MDERDPESAKVIPLPSSAAHVRDQNAFQAALDELSVRPVWTVHVCRHERSAVDGAARRVTCRDCGVDLDPVTVLARLAAARQDEIEQARHVRRELDYLTDRRDELRREESNAKARIRRARDRRADSEALAAALEQTGVRIDGYRSWDALNAGQRLIVVDRARRLVEAYHGSLSAQEAQTA